MTKRFSSLLILACVLATAGCTSQDANSADQNVAQGDVLSKGDAPGLLSNGWTIERKSSQMDGEVIVASKRIEASDSVFAMYVECAGENWSMRIESYGPDGESPNPYVSDNSVSSFGATTYPVGRSKLAGLNVQSLSAHFDLTNYANVISFDQDSLNAAYAKQHGFDHWTAEGIWNSAATIKSFLPVVAEVNNTYGKRELTLNGSRQNLSSKASKRLGQRT